MEIVPVPERNPARALFSAMRPAQWVKNGLVVIAPAAAGVALHPAVMARTAFAFAAFCLTASGVYLFNDVRDIAADRAHPRKRRRAIAAGQISPRVATGVGALLIAAAMGATLGLACWGLAVILAIYVANSFAYVYGVKRIAVIELASVAAGFFLRAIAGASVNNLFVSTWFLVVISFGALFLVVGKRAAEVHRLGAGAVAHRAVLAEYSESFLNSALTMTATVVVTGYCLWAFDTTKTGLSVHDHNVTAIRLTVVPVVLAILHILLELEGKGGEAPEELVLRDRTVQALGLVWIVLLAIGIYA